MTLIPVVNPTIKEAERLGFRFGDKGTHTSRTMMLDELTAVLAVTQVAAGRKDYAAAIIEENALAKPTLSTRRLSNQRLGELYGLDVGVGVFRVMRRLWDADQRSRPLLALLCAMASDPLLAGTASTILSMGEGRSFPLAGARGPEEAVGPRLNDAILDKVLRNSASSWTQSGHLEGRTFKKRRRVIPTPWTVTYALYLGRAVGFRGAELFSNSWMGVLDASPTDARAQAQEAKRLGLIDLSTSGDIVEIGLDRLELVQVGV
ncbi:MAG: hypothetical protein IPG75_20720 [Gemmatimonadetes bacterium]|nr:hypothetical protein [Gemmatimonadota bacterium]